MASRRTVELIDDLDQSVIADGGGSHTFSLNGIQYEIDLSEENGEKLRQALAPFIDAERRVGQSARTSRSKTSRSNAPQQRDAIRAWAREHGYTVSDRGRIAESVVAAYNHR